MYSGTGHAIRENLFRDLVKRYGNCNRMLQISPTSKVNAYWVMATAKILRISVKEAKQKV